MGPASRTIRSRKDQHLLKNISFWSGRDFLTRSRTRGYGGSTNCWGGNIRPMDEHDFHGSPIEHGELAQYYKSALGLVGLDSDSFERFDIDSPEDLRWWQKSVVDECPIDIISPEMLRARGFKTAVMQLQGHDPIRNFQDQFQDLFLSDDEIRLIVNATAIGTTGAEGKVDSLVAQSILKRKAAGKFNVIARKYVLAMGGLETTRFLINSGFNASPSLGRYYMNHPLIVSAARAMFVPNNDCSWVDSIATRRFYSDFVHLRQKPMAGIRAHIVPTREALADPANKIKNFRATLDWSKEGHGYKFNVELNFEQAPLRGSKITCSRKNGLDIFSKPKLHLDWKFSQADADTVNNAIKMVKRLLETSGAVSAWTPNQDKTPYWDFSRSPRPPILDVANRLLRPSDHHMGTCRMGAVVDTNCRIIGCDNLWVCSTAVFTSSGWANPTYTLLALALRLGDHLVALDA